MNTSYSQDTTQNTTQDSTIKHIPIEFTGIASRFLYLIRKMDMSMDITTKKDVVIQLMELCMEHTKFINTSPQFQQILYFKMNEFEQVILNEQNMIQQANIEGKIDEIIYNIHTSIKSAHTRNNMTILLSKAKNIHNMYAFSESLNNKVLLAINSARNSLSAS
jgi:hypothetical protein